MDDPHPLTARAKQTLARGDIQEAVAEFTEAAAHDGEAASIVANFAACGALRPRDLDAALDLLVRAATFGWTPAQAELRFLSGRQNGDWPDLRGRIDLEAWKRAPPSRLLAQTPRLRVFEGFATPAECDWLIERGRGNLRRAQVLQGAAFSASEGRTNSEADYLVMSSDIVVCLVRDRIAAAAGLDIRFFEVTKLLNYQPGQEYRRHSDYFEPSLAHEIEIRGQRVATFLLYLNDDYENGETEFPFAGVRYKGRKGDALLFLNVDAGGAPDRLSIHAGLAPAGGEKWLLSQWIRNKTVNGWMTPDVSDAPLDAAWVVNA